MDSILQALLSWQFLFFCLAVGAVVFVIRLFVEYGMENWWPLKQWRTANKDSKLWRSLILPILPIALGLLAGLVAKGYPYPEGITSTSGRLAFGLVGGFTSSLIVRLYVSFLSSKVSEFRDKVNTMLNQRTPSRDADADRANIAAKDQVAEEKDIADDLLGESEQIASDKVAAAKTVAETSDDTKEIASDKVAAAKLVASDKVAAAKVVADDKLETAKGEAADKVTGARDLKEQLERDALNK